MRKLILALAIALLVSAGVPTATPAPAVGATQTKVVIVVGATQGVTSSYRSDADAAAAVFANYTTNITKIYSPNATWAAVKAAAYGANILVYLGHGSGYPNPYMSYLQPNGDNGMGLNASAAGTDSNTQYYGENYMSTLGLAPNAVVILNHLCYASGDSEAGLGLPSLATAETRVDGYASGFLRGGAKAVIADGVGDISGYINGLFTGHTTIDALWKSSSVYYHGNLTSWASTRSPSYTSQIDPDIAHPQSDGDYYYRSMVSIPSLKTDDVISGQAPPFVSQSGTYYPIDPTRMVDTRGNGIGPAGALQAMGRYTYTIAGNSHVPTGAIAITANVTVTQQTALGWFFLSPEIGTSPGSSTINFPVKDDRANGVTVPLSVAGTVDAWYGAVVGNTAHLIIDVTGYYMADTSGDGYVQFGPKRFLDTRYGTGLTGRFQAGVARTLQIAGVNGLPASGITAITGNLTAVSPSQNGYLYAGPTANSTPSGSTLNFPAGDIRANNLTVKVNSDGTIGIVYIGAYTGGTTDVLLDITGYYTHGSGAQFHPLNPTRILDSRTPTGIAGPIPAQSARTLAVWTVGNVPTGAIAISANLTITQQAMLGYIAVGPTIVPGSPFSNLNYPVADDRANGVIVPLSGTGSIQFWVGQEPGGRAQLILDVNGYFL